MPPPYVVALIDLDEGPRMLTNLVGDEFAIGTRVRVQWRDRAGLPPLPVFAVEPGLDVEGQPAGATRLALPLPHQP